MAQQLAMTIDIAMIAPVVIRTTSSDLNMCRFNRLKSKPDLFRSAAQFAIAQELHYRRASGDMAIAEEEVMAHH